MIIQLKKLGLIINPVAGIGGRVGLKGSDGALIQEQAIALGAIPTAFQRTVEALEKLVPHKQHVKIVTYPAEMGAAAAVECGLSMQVIGAITSGSTTAGDTCRAARDLAKAGVDLLLFTGGDGTARDIYSAVGTSVPVLGIPAGVKIHSAVFGTNPKNSGELAQLYLSGRVTTLREAEVMDIDEEAIRVGVVSSRLFGYLKIPYHKTHVQNQKSPSPPGELYSLDSIAAGVIESMLEDWVYILGPGTTTRAITSQLGLEKTLIGVDVIKNRTIIAKDVNESQLLKIIEHLPAKIIITPIGGQGYLFGRGNQQISPEVIKRVGRQNILVISTMQKLLSLAGQPLWVDTGNAEVDDDLSGYIKVLTGYQEYMVYKVM